MNTVTYVYLIDREVTGKVVITKKLDLVMKGILLQNKIGNYA